MKKDRISQIIPIVIIILVVLIAIFALVSLGRVVFKKSNKGAKTEIDISRESLLNSSLSHSVRMTVRGPIVADESFRSYRIHVSPTKRTFTSFKGYLGDVIDSKDLSNNTNAYEDFIYALDKANLAKGKAFSGEADDVRGICATGKVVEFDIMTDNDSIKHLWTSTCKGSKGSLDASVHQLHNLFIKQIPEKEIKIPKFGN